MKRNLLTLMLAFLVAFGVNAQKGVNSLTGGKKVYTEGKIVKLNYQHNAKAVIFEEDFSDGALPTDWQNIDNAGNGEVWEFDNPGGHPLNSTTGSNGFAIFDSDNYASGNAEDCDLISPTIDCSALTVVKLKFEHYFYSGWGGAGEVFVTGDNGTNWTSLEAWEASSTANAEVEEYDISSVAAGSTTVKIRWHWTGDYSWWWAVDDVSVFEPEAHDLAVAGITPAFVSSGSTVTPVVSIDNLGASEEATYSVQLTSDEGYDQTVNVTVPIAAGGSADITFPDWTPADGSYTLTAVVTVTDDAVADNNTLDLGVTVMATVDAYVSYWDGSANNNGVLAVPTDQFTAWGTSAEMIRGMAWDNGTLYGLTATGAFGTVSMTDGTFTQIGLLGPTVGFWTNLAFDPNTEVMYAFALTGTYPGFTIGIYTIDVTTGVATLVANSSHTGTAAIWAFDNNSNLYCLEHQQTGNGKFYSVDEATAEMTEISGDIGGVISSNFQGMAYDFDTNKMYFQASGDGEMQGTYEINLETGAATLVGVPFAGQILGIVIPTTPVYAINFSVNMNPAIDAGDFIVGTDVVYVTGSFNGWDEPGTGESLLLEDLDADGYYTGTATDITAGEVQYKYFKNAGWSNGEWAGDPNRVRTIVDADLNLSDVWGGYWIYFLVTSDGSTPIEGATITTTVAKDVWVTDAAGEVNDVLKPGDYNYTVTATGYNDATGSFSLTDDYNVPTISMTLIGVNELASKGVSIYPNPSNGQFNVITNQVYNLQVVDLTGKVVKTQILDGNNLVTVEESGVYFLKFSNANGNFVQRVVVK